MKQKFNPEIWAVERKRFNPEQWLNESDPAPQKRRVKGNHLNSVEYDVEIVVQRIEASRLDLTCDYYDWFKLGAAFASEFGEAGRSYFHRISRFNPDYNLTECDHQYNKCLKGNKSGAAIKSFFFAAKQAGINVFVKPQS